MKQLIILLLVFCSQYLTAQTKDSLTTKQDSFLAKVQLVPVADTLYVVFDSVSTRFKYFKMVKAEPRKLVDTTQYLLYDGLGNLVTNKLNAATVEAIKGWVYSNDKEALSKGLKFGQMYILSETNTYGFLKKSIKIVGKNPTVTIQELKNQKQ